MLNYNEMDNVLKNLDKCAENMKTATETQDLLKDVLETTKTSLDTLQEACKDINANTTQIKNIEEKHKQIHSLLEDVSTEYKKIHSMFELLEIKYQTIQELFEKKSQALQTELKNIYQEINQNQKVFEKKQKTLLLTIIGTTLLILVATIIGFFI